eukprot:366055-Chlamydomonas_euryale.AAC.4
MHLIEHFVVDQALDARHGRDTPALRIILHLRLELRLELELFGLGQAPSLSLRVLLPLHPVQHHARRLQVARLVQPLGLLTLLHLKCGQCVCW